MDTVGSGRTFEDGWVGLLLLGETGIGDGGNGIRGRVPVAVAWGDGRSRVHAAHIERRLWASSGMGGLVGRVADI